MLHYQCLSDSCKWIQLRAVLRDIVFANAQFLSEVVDVAASLKLCWFQWLGLSVDSFVS